MRIPLLKYLAFFTSKPMSAETDIEKNGAEGERETYRTAKLPPKLIKFQTLIGICSPNVLRPDSRIRPPSSQRRTLQTHNRRGIQNQIPIQCQQLRRKCWRYASDRGWRCAYCFGGRERTFRRRHCLGDPEYYHRRPAHISEKVKGLPMRLEQYLHFLRTLREHIEERERELL